MTSQSFTQTAIEADAEVPILRLTRDFTGTVDQLMRAHTDPELFARWNGPDSLATVIHQWDCRTGGSWRYTHHRGEEEFGFHGCFHEVAANKIVQTFTFEGMPDGVALETLTFEDLGDGRVRLHAQSLVDNFTERDFWLNSMGEGVHEGYAKLDRLLADPAGH